MTYYKVSVDGTVIGTATSADLRRWQEKHGILLVCDINSAQYVMVDSSLYHDSWFEPITTDRVEYILAAVEAIDADEHEQLTAALELGEAIQAETETAEEDAEELNDGESTTDTTDVDPLSTASSYLRRLTDLESRVSLLEERLGVNAEDAEGETDEHA